MEIALSSPFELSRPMSKWNPKLLFISATPSFSLFSSLMSATMMCCAVMNSYGYLFHRSTTSTNCARRSFLICRNAWMGSPRTVQHPSRRLPHYHPIYGFNDAISICTNDIRCKPLKFQKQRSYSYSTSFSFTNTCCYSTSTSKAEEEERSVATEENSSNSTFYSKEYSTFQHLGVQSEVLLQRLSNLGFTGPSTIQASVFRHFQHIRQHTQQSATVGHPTSSSTNFIVGAETGSGKTLAYLLPLIDDILVRKQQLQQEQSHRQQGISMPYDYARAVILVPNKELAQQILRMACGLCAQNPNQAIVYGGSTTTSYSDFSGMMPPTSSSISTTASGSNTSEVEEDLYRDVVRVALLPGNLDSPMDFKPFRETIYNRSPPVDLLICTPAALGPWGLSPKNIPFFLDVQTLVIDEADMLLDGGFKRDLDNIFLGFRRADRLDVTSWEDDDTNEVDLKQQPRTATTGTTKTQHIFVGATIPNYGLKSVDAYIAKKFPNIQRLMIQGMHHARHNGLRYETLWLEDSVTSSNDNNNRNKVRMEQLVQMLKGNHTTVDLRKEKVMIFLNSIEDVDAATNALRRAGIIAIPYHAKIPLAERTENLDQFRKVSAKRNTHTTNENDNSPVLVSTDLASRGLDVPGVTAIVQLQFAGNVVAHLHRMGRCGRAGERNGRGIIFFNPREKSLVTVVRDAERQQQENQILRIHGDVMDDDDEEESFQKGSNTTDGTVSKAFSRRRGFTKKLKKIRREVQESSNS